MSIFPTFNEETNAFFRWPRCALEISAPAIDSNGVNILIKVVKCGMLGDVKGYCWNKSSQEIIGVLFSWGSFAVRAFYDDICDEGNTLIDL
jgi:hypothetical protein